MCRHPNVDLMNISGEADVHKNGMNCFGDEASNDGVVVYFAQKPGTSSSFETIRNAVSPSVNGTSPSLTKNNGNSLLRSPKTESDSIPEYLQPDRYEGLVEKVRKTIQQCDSDSATAKRLMAELQRKAERLLPGAWLQPTDLGLLRTHVDTDGDIDGGSDTASVSSIAVDKQTQYLARKSLKDAKCEICGLGFASVQSKMRHAKRIHPNDLDKISANTYEKTSLSHACSLCSKAFATAEQLSTHRRRRHDNERMFVCSVCERPYPLPSELTKHMKRVHGIVSNGSQTNDGMDTFSVKSGGGGNDSLASRPSSRSTYDGSEDMPDL